MGKTIMLSALIQTARGPEEPDLSGTRPAKRRQLRLDKAFRATRRQTSQQARGPYATLIVAPTSLINQWAEELKRSSKPGTLKTLVWHGQNRLDLEDAMTGEDPVDVVITSYGTLASEHKSEKSVSPIFDGMTAHFASQTICILTVHDQWNGCVSGSCIRHLYVELTLSHEQVLFWMRPIIVNRDKVKPHALCMPCKRGDDGRSQVLPSHLRP